MRTKIRKTEILLIVILFNITVASAEVDNDIEKGTTYVNIDNIPPVS